MGEQEDSSREPGQRTRSLGRMEPRGRLGAALGRGERESDTGRARSAIEIGATSPAGDSRRD